MPIAGANATRRYAVPRPIAGANHELAPHLQQPPLVRPLLLVPHRRTDVAMTTNPDGTVRILTYRRRRQIRPLVPDAPTPEALTPTQSLVLQLVLNAHLDEDNEDSAVGMLARRNGIKPTYYAAD